MKVSVIVPVYNVEQYLDKGLDSLAKQTLKDFDVNWIYVVVEAPDLDTNKERRKGQIPPEVFDRMVASYEPPTPDEYDEIIYAKQTK